MSIRISGSPRPTTPQHLDKARTANADPARKAPETIGSSQHRVHHHADHFVPASSHGPECATRGREQLPPAMRARVDQAIAAKAAKAGSGEVGPADRQIDVYFHVVNRGEGIRNGDVPREMIDAQIQVLNEAFASAGFSFVLREVTRTTNPQWYTAGMGDLGDEMKAALHRGDASDLNLYTSNPGEDLLGYATFPSEQIRNPKVDGVVIRADTLPGGAGAPYNEGDTGTHEVGHWLGLYHTFQDPYGKGDEVDDTPAHKTNLGTPPLGTDTLPELPGVDPVHNYMNYTDDAWMHEFTPGQEARMQAMWDVFRDPERERPSVNDGLDPLLSQKAV
jgi:hypothetical protein